MESRREKEKRVLTVGSDEECLVVIELKSGGTPLSVEENNTVRPLFLLTNVVKLPRPLDVLGGRVPWKADIKR